MQIKRGKWLNEREQRWMRSYNYLHPAVLDLIDEEKTESHRAQRIGVVAAIILHLALLFVIFPDSDNEKPVQLARQVKVYRLQQTQFKPPKQRVRRQISRPQTRAIPIPDPTPDDPEPIIDEETEVKMPPLEIAELDFGTLFSVPDAPPGPAFGAIPLAGDVIAPIRLHAPQPKYPEEARQARRQGVVVLETIIDAVGKVAKIKVLKGLPMGLTEAAQDAVAQWRFKPAKLKDEPVAVIFIITVSFTIH